jgi:hypothetical protein
LSLNKQVVSNETAENARAISRSRLFQIIKTKITNIDFRAKCNVVRVDLDIFWLETEVDQLLLIFQSKLMRVGSTE